MQTFLPYAGYAASARALDYKRLGKQRVEAYQILNAIQGKSKGWVNHPCTVMWRPYEQSLVRYGIAICNEWRSRGYKDTLLDIFLAQVSPEPPVSPAWLSLPKLHLSHQSNLVRKDPIYYTFNVPNDLPYFWPKP